jgi:hypothetical protein
MTGMRIHFRNVGPICFRVFVLILNELEIFGDIIKGFYQTIANIKQCLIGERLYVTMYASAQQIPL